MVTSAGRVAGACNTCVAVASSTEAKFPRHRSAGVATGSSAAAAIEALLIPPPPNPAPLLLKEACERVREAASADAKTGAAPMANTAACTLMKTTTGGEHKERRKEEDKDHDISTFSNLRKNGGSRKKKGEKDTRQVCEKHASPHFSLSTFHFPPTYLRLFARRQETERPPSFTTYRRRCACSIPHQRQQRRREL
jgi:hypothetical protein